jgi:hypothetical protein
MPTNNITISLMQGHFSRIFFGAEWQSWLEMSEKCPLCHLKMSVPQGKIAIQRAFFREPAPPTLGELLRL